MRLSEIQIDQLSDLTMEQIAAIVYAGYRDDGKQADVGLLLGSSPRNCHERVLCAAREYGKGRFKIVIPSGGVEWDCGGERLSEANYMTQILLTDGVPMEAILPENEATTTKENMIYGTLQFNRHLKIQNVRTVSIITSANHMRRSLALAKLFLPRSVQILCCPAGIPADPVRTLSEDDYLLGIAREEVRLMKGLIDNGLIDDIEF